MSILSLEDQKKAKKLIPLTQAAVFQSFGCQFLIDSKKYEKGICVQSEHLVVFASRGIFSSFTPVLKFHILNLKEIEFVDDVTVIFHLPRRKITLICDAATEFTQIMYRNYFFITTMWPQQMRAKINLVNNELPPIKYTVSPAQMFQFQYNAYCSMFKADYFHEVTKFFHSLITTGNAFADFSKLPLSHIDTAFGDPLSLRPVISTMMFCPLIYGYIIRNVTRPDFLKAIAPLVERSKKIKLLQCSKCMVKEGVDDLASAMLNNPKLQILFYDLSNNPELKEMSKLAYAFSRVRNPILYINLNNTGMQPEDVMNFMRALVTNDNLLELRYFLMRNAPTSKEAAKTFCQYLMKLEDKKLRSVDIGSISGGVAFFLNRLILSEQPIEYLSLAGSTFNDRDFKALIEFLDQTETLNELDLSDIKLTFEQVSLVIEQINENNNIGGIVLHLNGLKIGKNFANFLSFFSPDKLYKWKGLSLERCGLKAEIIVANARTLTNMTNLRILNIGHNLHYNQKKLKEAIHELFSLSYMSHLGLQGDKDNYIGTKGAKYVSAEMMENHSVFELDISNNQIGDEGLNAITDMVEQNNSIIELNVDGTGSKNIETFIRLFDVIAAHQSINEMPWPSEDIYWMIENSNKKTKQKVITTLALKQKLAEENMQKNQAATGLHSHLMKLQINEIDEMIDNLTLHVNKIISEEPIYNHSAITEIFHLPYPHVDADQEPTGLAINVEGIPQCYDAEEAKKEYIEEHNEGDMSVQFSSLCMRRPGAEEFVSKGQSNRSNVSQNNEVQTVSTYDNAHLQDPNGDQLDPETIVPPPPASSDDSSQQEQQSNVPKEPVPPEETSQTESNNETDESSETNDSDINLHDEEPPHQESDIEAISPQTNIPNDETLPQESNIETEEPQAPEPESLSSSSSTAPNEEIHPQESIIEAEEPQAPEPESSSSSAAPPPPVPEPILPPPITATLEDSELSSSSTAPPIPHVHLNSSNSSDSFTDYYDDVSSTLSISGSSIY